MGACALPLEPETDFLGNVFDSIPLPVLVVDADIHIIEFNVAAARLMARMPLAILHSQVGGALGCVHSSGCREGCGRAPECADCVIRSALEEALRTGVESRRTARMRFVREGHRTEIELLVSAAPVAGEREPLALLLLDDLREVEALVSPAVSSPDSTARATAPGRKTDNN